MVRRNLAEELPFMASEAILMEAVRRGGDRQEVHERLRVHARSATTAVLACCRTGDHVVAGDRLCVIEAMKMNTSIAAPTSGTVKAVEDRPSPVGIDMPAASELIANGREIDEIEKLDNAPPAAPTRPAAKRAMLRR